MKELLKIHYRCLECGHIFTKVAESVMASIQITSDEGCPNCQRLTGRLELLSIETEAESAICEALGQGVGQIVYF